MEKSKKIKVLFSSLFLLVIVFLLFIFLYKNKKTEISSQKKEISRLIVEPENINLEMGFSTQVSAFYLTSSGEKINVTDQADWSTYNLSYLYVGNKSNKGQIQSRKKEGNTIVTVAFKNEKINIPVKIFRAELKVGCLPRVIDKEGKREIRDYAKVGETVEWVSVYEKIGAPPYNYFWTGTDNFIAKDMPISNKKYDTEGIKEVNFSTVDSVGTLADANCFIKIIK